jgi:hypothetical protein
MKVTREKLSPIEDDLLTESDDVFFSIEEVSESMGHLQILMPKEVTKALNGHGIMHTSKAFRVPEIKGLMLKIKNTALDPKDRRKYIDFFEDPKSDNIIKKCIDVANENAKSYFTTVKLRPKYYGESKRITLRMPRNS